MERASTTSELILAAARRAVARRGPGRLTLSSVAAEAGVSRPTLYRWFPTKNTLLAALTAYEVERFGHGLRAVIAESPSRPGRLDAALRYVVSYMDETRGSDPIGADPAFALQSLADTLGAHVTSLTEWLGDALDEVPAVRAGVIGRSDAAEIFLRVAYSHYLVPSADTGELVRALRGFAGLGPRAAAVRAPQPAQRSLLRPARSKR